LLLFVCLSVSNFAQTDLHEIFREGWQWAIEQMIKFWWRSGSWVRIVTLVRWLWQRYALSQCLWFGVCFLSVVIYDNCVLFCAEVGKVTV